jgi:hypothetical protein
VRDRRHAPAALHPRKVPVPIVQEVGWSPDPVWTGTENLASPGFDPWNVQPVARRYTDYPTRPKKPVYCSKIELLKKVAYRAAYIGLYWKLSTIFEHTPVYNMGNPPYVSLRIGIIPAKIRNRNLPNIRKVIVRANLFVVYGEVICLFCKFHYQIHVIRYIRYRCQLWTYPDPHLYRSHLFVISLSDTHYQVHQVQVSALVLTWSASVQIASIFYFIFRYTLSGTSGIGVSSGLTLSRICTDRIYLSFNYQIHIIGYIRYRCQLWTYPDPHLYRSHLFVISFSDTHYQVHQVQVSALDLPWAAPVQSASICHFLEIQYARVFRLVTSLYVLRLKRLCVSRISHAWHITHPSHPLYHAISYLLSFQCNQK